MARRIIYPTIEKIIEYNFLVLNFLKVKKADTPRVLSKTKLYHIVEGCKKVKGDRYDKGAFLFTELIRQHAFASGNRRTAFIVTKEFLVTNKARFKIKDDPRQARMMTGIREGFYTQHEIKEWIKNGKIRAFKR